MSLQIGTSGQCFAKTRWQYGSRSQNATVSMPPTMRQARAKPPMPEKRSRWRTTGCMTTVPPLRYGPEHDPWGSRSMYSTVHKPHALCQSIAGQRSNDRPSRHTLRATSIPSKGSRHGNQVYPDIQDVWYRTPQQSHSVPQLEIANQSLDAISIPLRSIAERQFFVRKIGIVKRDDMVEYFAVCAHPF